MPRELRRAVLDAGIARVATCHSLRHTFATGPLRGATDVRTMPELLGHKNLHATQIYLHPMDAWGIRRPEPTRPTPSSNFSPCILVGSLRLCFAESVKDLNCLGLLTVRIS